MRKLLLLLLIAGTAYAEGPLFRHKDTDTDQEFQNVYHDVRSISTSISDPLRLQGLTVSTFTVTSSATINSLGVVTSTITTLTVTNPLAITGVTNGLDAVAGKVGEKVETTHTAIGVPASGVVGDAINVSLTAGDWDCYCLQQWDKNGSTIDNYVLSGISVTSGNSFTGLTDGQTNIKALPPTSTSFSQASVAMVRMNLTSTTTVYLKYYIIYSAGNPQVRGGRLTCRRVR